ncbi:MAG TPA: MerR family transcriptional regulator [Blastocatellia bacterium]|nr:MerR family transcriptional regulator [Blastocatellia bacterium]
MLRIGDFSRLSQVSVKALRFYDEIGLLKPTYVDRATGYRYYAATLLERLNRILVFKELGFSLEEIALLLQDGLPAGRVREALAGKRAELSRRIAREQARLRQVEVWLAQVEREGRVPDHEIALRQVAPRLVASVRDRIDSYDDTAELFAELSRHLKKHHAAGQRAAVWHACAGQSERIDCEAVILLNSPVPESKRVKVYRLPATVNACLIHEGSDETITQAYRAAHSWIKAQGYAIAGPLRELYWQGGVAQDDSFGVTEIQYPIRKSQPAASQG